MPTMSGRFAMPLNSGNNPCFRRLPLFEIAGDLSGSVNHLASLIVDPNYSVMRPAGELCELNRVGDRVWPGIPQAAEPQHAADKVTTFAVHAWADLINGHFFLFWMRCGARDGCSVCDGFGFARNTAPTFDVFYWLQVTKFEVLLNSAPNGLKYVDIFWVGLHIQLFRSNARFGMADRPG